MQAADGRAACWAACTLLNVAVSVLGKGGGGRWVGHTCVLRWTTSLVSFGIDHLV